MALCGAHTVGSCHLERSGYDGAWTEQKLKFDNSYFKDRALNLIVFFCFFRVFCIAIDLFVEQLDFVFGQYSEFQAHVLTWFFLRLLFIFPLYKPSFWYDFSVVQGDLSKSNLTFFLQDLLHKKWQEETNSKGKKQFRCGNTMMLPSDMALVKDPSFKRHVLDFAEDENLWFSEFGHLGHQLNFMEPRMVSVHVKRAPIL